MVLRTNSAESGTDGANVTVAGSGGLSGAAFSRVDVGAGASFRYIESTRAHGRFSYALTGAASTATFVGWTGYSVTSCAARMYYNMGAAIPTAQLRLLDIRASSATVARIELTTAGRIIVQNSAGSVFTFTTALSPNTFYRIELATSVGTTDGVIKCDIYLGDSTTPAQTGYVSTTANTGSAAIAEVRFGSAATAAWTGTAYLDDLAVNDGTTTYIGPYIAPPPNVSVGSEQVVTSFAKATLQGTVVSTAGLPIQSTTWTALSSAPTITNGAASLTAEVDLIKGAVITGGSTPQDTTYQYRLTAVQSDGQQASAVASVRVLYANRYRATSQWEPQPPLKHANETWK